MQPEFPEPVGIFRDVERPCYDELVLEQVTTALSSKGTGDLAKLFDSEDSWTV
jgi:2-oxoglutarate ferredoxin oxidoreductase subunit beta